jgi:hypothetical protein
MEATWSEFKKFVDARYLSIQYIELYGNYHLKAIDGNFELDCILPIGVDNSDTTDFETHYKAAGNKSFSDIDGSTILRVKASKKGWVFALIPIEFTTSKISSVVAKLPDNSDRAGVTYKMYNASDVELTSVEDEPNVVKTVVDVELPYDFDVIAGQARHITRPTSDVRLWAVVVPDVPASMGGSKEMVGGVNFKFIDPADKIEMDGRAAKYMTYSSVYHSNKFRFIIRHDAGVQHEISVMLEIFRA